MAPNTYCEIHDSSLYSARFRFLLIFSLSYISIYIGIIFIIFGVVLITINASIIEVTSQYDDTSSCALNTNCTITLTLEKDMQAPIFVFYELHNFYQNHRRYIRSKSATQLAGTEISSSDAYTACDPAYLMKHIGIYKSWGGYDLAEDAVANPCGLIAKSFFNGLLFYFIYHNFTCVGFADSYANFVSVSDGTKYTINEAGISWPNDVGKKFKRCPNSNQTQWLDPENGNKYDCIYKN